MVAVPGSTSVGAPIRWLLWIGFGIGYGVGFGIDVGDGDGVAFGFGVSFAGIRRSH